MESLLTDLAWKVLNEKYSAVVENTGQTYSLFEGLIQPQSGSSPHTHSREDESFYV